MNSAANDFRDAIRSAGLKPPDDINPGTFHRFPGEGKSNGNFAGWCKLFADGNGGIYGDHSTGLTADWQAKREKPYTQAEREAFMRRVAEEKAQAAAEREAKHAEAAKRAALIFKDTQRCATHEYLTRKNVQPHGARLYGEQIVLPMRDAAGALHTLQFIDASGEKRFLPGGRVTGCYFSIGNPTGAVALCVTEGFATGATVNEATGFPVAVAFNAGNLESVAKTMRERFPHLPIVICADDDSTTPGNPGITKATAAARAVGGTVAIPDFGTARPEGANDFNDMAVQCGVEAIRRAVGSAMLVDADVTPMPTPEPLPSLPDVLPFDYSYLPDVLSGYVRDISERMQCPPDFAAVGVLVMMATIIGRKVGIRPMRHNDWTVIPNLWGAVVGNSGVMKSPTLSAALTPIKKLQATAYESFNTAKAEHDAKAELAKLQKSIKKTNARAALKENVAVDVVKDLLLSTEAEDAPILKRYITNNASYEALGELMMENPNGLMVESDELIGLLKQLDASGQEVARSFYLTAADGNSPYTVDRIMRGKGLHIEALCLSIIGGIQPGVLAEYVRQATAGGAGADGLLQRIGLMVYPDIAPDWKEVDRYPDSVTRDAVNRLAEKLDTMTPADVGAEVDMYGGVPYLRFDDDAQTLFSEWRAALEHRLRSGEEHPAIVSHLSKYRKLIPSLALINHLCDGGQGAISEAALLRAITFSEYLESHAQRIYSYATRPDIEAAKTLLRRLASGKLPDVFKARDLCRKGWAGLETPVKAQAAIDLLVDYNHLLAEKISTGGRPTTDYHWVRRGAA